MAGYVVVDEQDEVELQCPGYTVISGPNTRALMELLVLSYEVYFLLVVRSPAEANLLRGPSRAGSSSR